MSVKALVQSNIELSKDILSSNNIDLDALLEDGYLPRSEYLPRYKQMLLLLEEDNKNREEMQFLLINALIMEGNYDLALECLNNLNSSISSKKMQVIYYLMSKILGKNVKSQTTYNNQTNLDRNHKDIMYSIYEDNYKKAKAKYGRLYDNGSLSADDILISSLLNVLIDRENQVILDYIENLDIEALEKYFNTKYSSDIIELQKSLLEVLKRTLSGVCLPEPKELPKQYMIYDVFNCHQYELMAKISTNAIVRKFSETILLVNERNREIYYNSGVCEYIDSILFDVYNYLVPRKYSDLLDYLYQLLDSFNLGQFKGIFNVLVFNVRRGLRRKEDFDTLIAPIMELIVDLLKPHDKKGLYYLKDHFELKLKMKVKPTDTLPFDLFYNYNIPNIDDLIERFLKDKDKYISLVDTNCTRENRPFAIIIFARECYNRGDLTKGDELLSYAYSTYTHRFQTDIELRRFANIIKSHRESLIVEKRSDLATDVKQLIRNI